MKCILLYKGGDKSEKCILFNVLFLSVEFKDNFEFGFLQRLALGDVVEFEILPPGTAAWLCVKDK